jgi:hypothetical protein
MWNRKLVGMPSRWYRIVCSKSIWESLITTGLYTVKVHYKFHKINICLCQIQLHATTFTTWHQYTLHTLLNLLHASYTITQQCEKHNGNLWYKVILSSRTVFTSFRAFWNCPLLKFLLLTTKWSFNIIYYTVHHWLFTSPDLATSYIIVY